MTIRSVMLPRLGHMSVTLDNAAETIASLYERTDEFERQKRIMHLGLVNDNNTSRVTTTILPVLMRVV